MTTLAGLWGIAPGADFAGTLVHGLLDRLGGRPPQDLARVTVIVPTRSLQQGLSDAFLRDGQARLLPRIRVLDDLADDPALGLRPADPPLVRMLTLARLVDRLIAADPSLAAPSAVHELALALADLLDEIEAEGVAPDALARIDVADKAAHWQASLRFLSILGSAEAAGLSGPEGRLRTAVTAIADAWSAAPPRDPVIVAGSTGSRAPARLLMRAVATLPQGALVLPGFDFGLPPHAWSALSDPLTGEDHPQFRFARLLSDLGVGADAVRPWHGTTQGAPQNALVSLALRPAPVTDQWRTEGPALGDPGAATQRLALIEAPDPRSEAAAIACAMRDALEQGLSACLVTPDRLLARRVTAVLDGWRLRPDDSAGRPLSQTPPGRLLRHAAALLAERLTAEALVVLLKHPLTHSGADRGPHLLCTREIELRLRRHGPPFPDAAMLTDWARGDRAPAGASRWADWLAATLPRAPASGLHALGGFLVQLHRLVEGLASGPDGTSQALWTGAAGAAARAALDALAEAAPSAAPVTAFDLARLLDRVLSAVNVPDDTPTHPRLSIRGPREARSTCADVMILAGLNDGTWPARPAPDPWMSRGMRLAAGLLLPERQIGLSAHDFQIAAGASRVILTRARRDDDADTVPSRWLNRLTNLMSGLPGGWDLALAAMRARGDHWLALGAALAQPETADPPARRPAPAPPPAARPSRLSITQVQTLIRDPYAIYARHVLRLAPLDPLTLTPDPRDRGTLLHGILESLVTSAAFDEAEFARDLVAQAAERLAAEVPWPAARRLWLARLAAAAPAIAAGEADRRQRGNPVRLEARAELVLPEAGFTLTGKIDRIDQMPDGAYLVYDYKSGDPPTKPVQAHFDRQLALSALCVAAGGVPGLTPGPVAGAWFLSLAAQARVVAADAEALDADATRADLLRLLAAWADPSRGYVSRRAVQRTLQGDAGDYDHLARYGEWAQTDAAAVTPVGQP